MVIRCPKDINNSTIKNSYKKRSLMAPFFILIATEALLLHRIGLQCFFFNMVGLMIFGQ